MTMVWEPFALAVIFGLLISAGLYFVVMWPQVAPDDDAPDEVAAPAPATDEAAPAAATPPARATSEPAADTDAQADADAPPA